MKKSHKVFLNLTFLAASVSISAFISAENKAKNGSCSGEPDYLLVLGCRVRGDKPEETLATRIDAAADFLKQHKKTKAICCGGIVHTDQTKSEAQAICEGLLSAGIDASRIILEGRSTTTEENFINAKKIIDELNPDSSPEIAFLSSEFHLLRAGKICERAGVNASSVAAPSPKSKRLKNYARELIVFPAVYKRR